MQISMRRSKFLYIFEVKFSILQDLILDFLNLVLCLDISFIDIVIFFRGDFYFFLHVSVEILVLGNLFTMYLDCTFDLIDVV